jgi:hypothetical protein
MSKEDVLEAAFWLAEKSRRAAWAKYYDLVESQKVDDELIAWANSPRASARAATQVNLLNWIGRNPGIVMRRLSDGPGIEKKDVVENIRLLINQGLVTTVAGSHGAKHHYLHNYDGDLVPIDHVAHRG